MHTLGPLGTNTAVRLAEDLGHAIEWSLLGRTLAQGHCRDCGANLCFSRRGEHARLSGEALDAPCPGPSTVARPLEEPLAKGSKAARGKGAKGAVAA